MLWTNILMFDLRAVPLKSIDDVRPLKFVPLLNIPKTIRIFPEDGVNFRYYATIESLEFMFSLMLTALFKLFENISGLLKYCFKNIYFLFIRTNA